MTPDELVELFQKYMDSDIGWESVKNRRSQRPDLHGFLLLDELLPYDPNDRKSHYDDCVIAAAEHDQVYYGFDVERLAAVITDEQIGELVACGILCTDADEGLFSFA